MHVIIRVLQVKDNQQKVLKYILETPFYLQLIFLLETVVVAMKVVNSHDFQGQCNLGLATQQQWPWNPGG